MQKKDVLVLNMKEQQSKKLAQAMSSDTCRKIMDALAEKDYTETELAKNLGLPLSTVHYNIEQLVSSGLVIVEEYHYSPKGKEVQHYKLASKYIIITSTPSFDLTEKLKAFLPVLVLLVLFSLGINFYSPNYGIQEKALAVGDARMMDEGLMAAAAPSEEIAAYSSPLPEPRSNNAWWFLGGAIIAVILCFLSIAIINHFKRN